MHYPTGTLEAARPSLWPFRVIPVRLTHQVLFDKAGLILRKEWGWGLDGLGSEDMLNLLRNGEKWLKKGISL